MVALAALVAPAVGFAGGCSGNDESCDTSDVCCCSGDIGHGALCGRDGPTCEASFTLIHDDSGDCFRNCVGPLFDSAPRDTGAPDASETDASDTD